MNRWTVLLATLLITAVVVMGCSGSGVNPVTPTAGPEVTAQNASTGTAQTHLWGYWDIYFDFENQTVEAIPNHHAEFAANVVSFLNSKGGLAFGINETIVDPAFVDVDIDVSMTHPLAGLPIYDGYDVRGIFVADGSKSLDYDSDCAVADIGVDQYMLDDPDDADGGNADGYTRWFNPDEFPLPGLLGYLPGKFATPGYMGSATVNPYKYFADDLDSDGDLWDFLTTTGGNGVFSSGATNTRNYYLRFPNPVPGVKYGYAVVASWKGEAPEDHPANAPEAQVITTTITDNIYYVDGTDNGGDFIADIAVQGWGAQPSTITVESDVLLAPYLFDSIDMTPVGGGATYSTYHVEIPTDNVTFNSVTDGDAEYWVICEYSSLGYLYPEEPAPPAPDAPLASFFRFNDLFISDVPYNADPICDVQMVTTEFEGWGPVPVEVDATGSSDPDPGDTLTFEWDFDGDDVYGDTYDSGTDDNPTYIYDWEYSGDISLKLTDSFGATVYCDTDPFVIEIKSCASLTCPSAAPTTMIGSNRLYNWDPQPVLAGNTRVIAAYSSAYQMCTINVTGTSVYDLYYNNPSYSIYDTAVATNGTTTTLYYYDSGSSTQLYTATYTGSGFSGIRTAYGPAIPGGYYLLRVACNGDNDYPVILTRNSTGSEVRAYNYDGSSWGSGVVVPASLASEYGSYSYIQDFEYDWTTGYYYIVDYYNAAGIHAFDASGNVVWQDTTIWAAVNSTSWNPGVFIDTISPECRLIAMAGMNTTGGTTYWARWNPVGGGKTTGTTSGGTYGTTFTTFQGRGCVQVDGGTARFLASTYGGNVWSSTVVPGW